MTTIERLSLAMLVFSVCTAQVKVFAEPITLRFVAEVQNIRNVYDFDPGVSVQVGDQISGQFTFEPDDGSNSISDNSLTVVQPFSGKLIIDGLPLETPEGSPGIQIRVFDNNFIICDCGPGESIPNPGPFDSMEVSSTLAPHESAALPDITPIHSYWKLDLRDNFTVVEPGTPGFGLATIFDHAHIPSDVATWNALNFERLLTVRLRGQAQPGVTIVATVSDFVAVPEPSAIVLACSLFTLLSRRRRTRSH